MKLAKYIVVFLCLNITVALAEDGHYDTEGLTGQNEDQNNVFFFNLWQTYTSALKHISEPPPKTLSPDVPFDEKKLMLSRYTYLFHKMLEVRVCVHQEKPITLSEEQTRKIKLIDSYLKKMDLWYPATDLQIASAMYKMGDEGLHDMVNQLLQ